MKESGGDTAGTANQRLKSAQSIWLKIHRWLGLTIGLPLAIIGLSGSLIMLFGTFVSWQHGDILEAPYVDKSQYSPPTEWISAARLQFGPKFEIAAIAAPHSSPLASSAALVIGHTRSGPEGDNHKIVALNPDTAKIRGSFDLETTYGFIPNIIHTSLLIPFVGLDIVAIIGIITLLSVGSGLYLWWPRPNQWRRSLTYRPGLRGLAKLRNLHDFVAIYATVGLVLLSATGVWMLKPNWVDPVISPISKVRSEPAATSDTSKCKTPTTAESALVIASKRFPEKSVALLLTPEDNSPYFDVGMSSADDINPRDGDTSVLVDARCPRIASIIEGASLTAAESAKKWTVPMHNGEAFGIVGQALVFMAGLALPTLYVTGFILWWRKRKYRKA